MPLMQNPSRGTPVTERYRNTTMKEENVHVTTRENTTLDTLNHGYMLIGAFCTSLKSTITATESLYESSPSSLGRSTTSSQDRNRSLM